MKRKLSKSLSIILTMTIVISAIIIAPVTVSAAGTANDIVNVANGEVGVSGSPNKYTYWLGSIGGSYSYAWCHAFVSWCANQAGAGDKVPRTASCASGVSWFKSKNEWKSRSSGYTPKAGDIIYFDYGSNGTYDHVGIVTSSSGGRVYTIEGNARNAVKVNGGYSNGYSLSNTDILGYGTPSYSQPSIIIPTGSQNISDGEYHIVSALDNNMGLDVEAASSDLCANIQLYNNVLDDSQVFVVNYLGDGYYKITNKHSGKSLDVANGGMESGTNVWQYDYTGDNAQKWIIKESGDGKYFNIVSAKNGLYLDVDGGIAENCRNIRTYSYNNTNAQKWKFIAFGNSTGRTLSNGDYHIVTVLDESKGLDVYGGYKENGTNVDIYSNLQDESQVFTVTYKGNGYYSIINKYSNKSLDCQNGNTVSGTNVQTYEYDNVDQKQWIIKESGDGQSFNIISKNSGLYLDVKSGDSANYSNVQVHIGNNTNAQKWKFVAYNSPKNSSIKDGNYHIVSKLNKNFGLDVAGALDDDAINVRLYNNIYDSNQVFNVVYLNDGYYKITNVKTGKSLDVASASAYKGANLQQYTYKDVNQQKWIIEDSGDNKNYYISSKNAGLYLTSESEDIENGTNVFLTINDYSDRQQWEFTLSNLNGDVDLDNFVTVADATLLQKYVVGIATLTDDQKLLADCNGDGVINVRDATYIQKTIVKIPVYNLKNS